MLELTLYEWDNFFEALCRLEERVEELERKAGMAFLSPQPLRARIASIRAQKRFSLEDLKYVGK